MILKKAKEIINEILDDYSIDWDEIHTFLFDGRKYKKNLGKAFAYLTGKCYCNNQTDCDNADSDTGDINLFVDDKTELDQRLEDMLLSFSEGDYTPALVFTKNNVNAVKTRNAARARARRLAERRGNAAVPKKD